MIIWRWPAGRTAITRPEVPSDVAVCGFDDVIESSTSMHANDHAPTVSKDGPVSPGSVGGKSLWQKRTPKADYANHAAVAPLVWLYV